MQVNKSISNQLSENTIFDGLTPEEVSSILPCVALYVKRYGSQECVLDKGAPPEGLGIVLNGELTVCEETANGSRPVQSIEKNETFGESEMFSTASKVPHRVIAQKSAEVLYLSPGFFLNLCEQGGDCALKTAHQKVAKNMLRLLSDRTIMLSKKIAYLTASDLKTKIAMYLRELYEATGSSRFTMPLNRDRLAEFFDVARPSLSRELINMKSAGVIDFHRSAVIILDPDALYRLARGW